MAFSLHPAGPEDAEDITRIFQAAFKNNSIMGHFHPHTPEDVRWKVDLKFFSTQIAEQGIYGGRVTKLVEDSTGKTVAFSKWDYPYEVTPEKKETLETRARDRENEPHVEGSNDSLMNDFFKQLMEGRKKWIVPEETYFLHTLAVHPDYQRRGLGSMLIRPGLEAADKAGAQTYIEASPAGLGLYMKHGWEPVDEMVINMRSHGVYDEEEIERHTYLMREPGAPNKLGKVDVGKLTE